MSGTFHPRRKRRPDDGRFLPQDRAAWERLAAKAEFAARHPTRPAEALGHAAEVCRRAVPPPGHAVRGSVFLRLVLEAGNFATLGARWRVEKAGALAELAAACAAVLEGPVGRSRKDLE